MKAIRIRAAPADRSPIYSAANPAPSSALQLSDVEMPKPMHAGDMVVRVKATTVVRDNLTWPEVYSTAHPGNDFAGVITEVYDETSCLPFKPGDEVYGMISAQRGGAWAEYAIVTIDETSMKPTRLLWEEAVVMPLSAMTAEQALFDQAGIKANVYKPEDARRILVTGAAGGVGTYLVQFALTAGHLVVAATSSRARSNDLLRSLGVQNAIEYPELTPDYAKSFDVVIDTVGGETLQSCWPLVKDNGSLVTIDSASWDFVREHREKGIARGLENVQAKFFIVEPTKRSMARISDMVQRHGVKTFIAKTMPLHEAQQAYELCQSGRVGTGKIVLVP